MDISMVMSTSQDANSCLAIQEIMSILWHQKVHYRVHKIQALVSILSQRIQSKISHHSLTICLHCLLQTTKV
jgi:hypothetical protein